MDVNLPIQSGALRVTQYDRSHPSILKANRGNHGIVHFDSRMVIIIPKGMSLNSWAHKPAQQVEIVRRLTHDNSAAFAFPCSAPGIGEVVSRFAPAEHNYNRQHGLAKFASIDSILHPLHRLVPAALADHSEFDTGSARRRNP